MKHSHGPPSFDDYRLHQLEAATRPVWLFNLAIHSAAILRSLVTLLHGQRDQGTWETLQEAAIVATYLGIHSVPAAAVLSGRPYLLRVCCMASHLMNSTALWSAGLGLTPCLAGKRTMATMHAEIVACAIHAFQCQMSLPVMAVLHALCQSGWVSIVYWQLGVDGRQALARFVFNYMLMMLVSWALETRLRRRYQALCYTCRQQQQQQLQGKEAAACSHSSCMDRTSQDAGTSPWAGKCQVPEGSGARSLSGGPDNQAHHAFEDHSRCLPGGGKPESAESELDDTVHLRRERGDRPDRNGGAATGKGPDSDAHQQRGLGVGQASHSSQMDPVKGIRLSRSPAATTAAHTAAVPQLVADKASGQPTLAPAAPPAAPEGLGISRLDEASLPQHGQLTPRRQHAARDLLRDIKQGRTLPYQRGRNGGSNTVCVKMEGVELEQLPPELPELLQQQLGRCMPGVTMTGLAIRSGCVMLTMDLMHPEGEEGEDASTRTVDRIRDVITHLMRAHAMGQGLQDGADMSIQVRDELALCHWDGSSGSYIATDPAALAALDLPDLAACRMIGAQPAVLLAMPDRLTEDGTRSGSLHGSRPVLTGASVGQRLRLTVALQLPGNCQLHGWQPAGVAAPAGEGQLLDNVPVVNAMLLVRRLDGGYLPVVVERVARAGSDETTHDISAQVVVTLEGLAPAALRLELWYELAAAGTAAAQPTAQPDVQPSPAQRAPAQPTAQPVLQPQLRQGPRFRPGLQVLVAHMPLLLLPCSWKEAAAELLQHIDDLGGVTPCPFAHAHGQGQTTNAGPGMLPDTHAAQSFCHDTGSSSQPLGNEGPWDNQPLLKHCNPQASDSASSPRFAPKQPPSSTQSVDPAACLLTDLGVWLTQYTRFTNSSVPHSVTSHLGGDPDSVTSHLGADPDSVTSHLGDDLLVYAVQRGLGALACAIVGVMQRIEQQQAPTNGSARSSPQRSARTPCLWLHRVVYCDPSGMGSDALPGRSGGRTTSLLHAAMNSGDVEILGQVFSWAGKHGGPYWAWPWELEDATGCTPLHLAAAQPAAGACAALLKTVVCMLPGAQVQAARSAWLHCSGGVGATPAELYASASNGGDPGRLWVQQEAVQEHTSAPGPSSVSPSGTSGTSQAPVEPPPLQPSIKTPSWLSSLVEVWVAPESGEYQAWAMQQVPPPRRWWVTATLALVATCLYRSALEGCLQYEWLHTALHGLAYMPFVIARSNRFANRQGGLISKAMLLSPSFFHCLAYCAKASLPIAHAPMWASAGKFGGEAGFVIVIDAPSDQAPLWWLLAARAVVAFFESVAYRAIHVPFPLHRALLVQLAALAVATLCRARQLRAFYAWKAAEARRKALPGGERGVRQENGSSASASLKKDN